MAAPLTKNYRLLRTLNASHGAIGRWCAGTLAGAGALVVTLDSRLAAQHVRTFLGDDFKLGARRANWYASRGWPRLNAVSDPFFDFTEGLDERELAALWTFLERRGRTLHPGWLATDRLFVLARQGHLQLERGDEPAFRDTLERYEATMNAALAQLDAMRPVPGASTRAAKPAPAEPAGDFSIEDATAALADLTDLMPAQDWPWYVVSGTFLGIVREGGFLAHDVDIDIGIDADGLDFAALVEHLGTSPDFVIRKLDHQLSIARVDGRHTLRRLPVLVKLVHRTGINIDVFVHHREGDVVWHGSNIHRWDNRAFDKSPYELAGISVLGPTDADAYLTENYGNWRVPVKEFSATTGTPNLTLVRNLFSPALFLKRTMHHLERGEAEAERIENQMIQSNCLRHSDDGLTMNREFIGP